MARPSENRAAELMRNAVSLTTAEEVVSRRRETYEQRHDEQQRPRAADEREHPLQSGPERSRARTPHLPRQYNSLFCNWPFLVKILVFLSRGPERSAAPSRPARTRSGPERARDSPERPAARATFDPEHMSDSPALIVLGPARTRVADPPYSAALQYQVADPSDKTPGVAEPRPPHRSATRRPSLQHVVRPAVPRKVLRRSHLKLAKMRFTLDRASPASGDSQRSPADGIHSRSKAGRSAT